MIVAASTVPSWFWGALAGLGILVVIFGGALPTIRTQRAKSTIDLQAAELEASEKARTAQERRFTDALAEQERRCSAQLAQMDRRHASEMGEIRGQLAAMTPKFARQLAELLRGEGVGGHD